MCGIAGIKAKVGEVDNSLVREMTALMFHRGPIEDGYLAEKQIGLGMRRLSIIDIAGGHQPVYNEDGTVAVVLNGQIYNYVELRDDLIKRGHRLSTHSDTEVLVHLYEEMGEGFLKLLNGMFAFAIWDSRNERLMLARDRLGVKPLYYFEDHRHFAFASELKALLRCDFVPREIDKTALANYLAFLYVPGPRTPLRGVAKLPPGHCLVVDASGTRTSRYWNLAEHCTPRRAPREELVEGIRSLLDDSVRLRLRSDVPVGAFLSGGLDSSALVAYASRRVSEPLRTFAVRFEGDTVDELGYARLVADAFGTRHQELSVSPADALAHLPRLVWHLDEPSADSAIVPSYLVSEFAARELRVVLSGLGGDELFGGYARYFDGTPIEHRYRNVLSERVRRRIAALTGRSRSRLARRIRRNALPFEERYAVAVSNFLASERAELMGEDRDILDLGHLFAKFPPGDSVNRLLGVDMETYLPDDVLHITDRMSMAVSLEARTPFLDYRLVEFCAGIPGDYKVSTKLRTWKSILKDAMAPVLPRAIIERPKKGFNAPVLSWVKELLPVISDVLRHGLIVQHGVLNRAAVERVVGESGGSVASAQRTWTLLVLEVWHRVFLGANAGAKPEFTLHDLRS